MSFEKSIGGQIPAQTRPSERAVAPVSLVGKGRGRGFSNGF